ncbi:hypothetical protein M413DRAFT_408814 [Hebeloma cylindrosporum]|uniref:Uncharacterized protein n=1 Tax=Hebeloma cylindrosporum TaxID=76867 RepID=A0A0C3C1J9_HEBCY|nr:hypothetical protein M413DRAFT_408814 [Hebeloma cylindrosporum h7]
MPLDEETLTSPLSQPAADVANLNNAIEAFENKIIELSEVQPYWLLKKRSNGCKLGSVRIVRTIKENIMQTVRDMYGECRMTTLEDFMNQLSIRREGSNVLMTSMSPPSNARASELDARVFKGIDDMCERLKALRNTATDIESRVLGGIAMLPESGTSSRF